MKKKMEKLKSVVKLTCLPFVAALCLAAVSCGNLSGDLANIKDAPISPSNVLYNADGTPNNGGTWKHRSGRVVDNEHPLFLTTFYAPYNGGDIWGTPGVSPWKSFEISSSPLVYDGYKLYGQEGDTLLGRWNAVPDHIKPYTSLILHHNNNDGCPTQEIKKAFFEAECKVAQENNIPITLLVFTAATNYGLDDNWVRYMVQKYPVIEAIFSTESFWTGNKITIGDQAARYMKLAHELGIYFIWSDGNPGGSIEGYVKSSALANAMRQYGGDNFIWIYKNTRGIDKQDLADISYMQGFWLTNYTCAWGGLMDNWKRNRNSEGSLYKLNGGFGDLQSLLCEPEATVAQEMADIWAGGGVVYSWEAPMYSIGIENKSSPLFSNVTVKMMEYAIANPAPTKTDILNETKVFICADLFGQLGNGNGNPQFYDGLNLNQANWFTYTTGRYYNIPFVPYWLVSDSSNGTNEATRTPQQIRERLDKNGGEKIKFLHAKATGEELTLFNKITDKSTRKATFDSLYEQQYVGDAFASKVSVEGKNIWILYNSIVNKVMDPKKFPTIESRVEEEYKNYAQSATIPVGNGKMEKDKIKDDDPQITLRMLPHLQVMLEDNVTDRNSISLFMDNYRTERSQFVTQNWNELTGGDIKSWMQGHYNVQQYYIDNPKEGREWEFHWRQTDFTIKNLKAQPIVQIDKNRSQAGQYDPVASVTYDPATKEAKFSIISNGYVYLEIMDLQFESNSN